MPLGKVGGGGGGGGGGHQGTPVIVAPSPHVFTSGAATTDKLNSLQNDALAYTCHVPTHYFHCQHLRFHCCGHVPYRNLP